MKKIVSFLAAHILFYIGHIISVTWKYKINKNGYGYNLYSWLMVKSSEIRDWGCIKTPWKKINT